MEKLTYLARNTGKFDIHLVVNKKRLSTYVYTTLTYLAWKGNTSGVEKTDVVGDDRNMYIPRCIYIPR